MSVVYLYFQIPLMILVIAPALDGLRPEWREASANLGGSRFHYWRHVGLPVLLPSILGAMILLFGNAFSAYATAYALTGGAINLVPLLIGQNLGGDVLSNPHLSQALAFGMIVVIAITMAHLRAAAAARLAVDAMKPRLSVSSARLAASRGGLLPRPAGRDARSSASRPARTTATA